MRHSRTRYGGLEVHNDSIAVAAVANEPDAEVISRGTLGTRQADIDQLMRKMPSQATPLDFVEDAGPCGSGRSRSLMNNGPRGGVVAPSVIPHKAGDRVHTDRRDAVPLARLLRSGDRTRAREEALRELTTAPLRRNALLLRHDIRDTGRAAWGPAHLRWLADVVCPTPAQQTVFQADGRAVTDHPERLQRLEQELQDHVNTWRLQPVVAALQAWRGVPFPVAVPRVDTPRPLMKDRGLIPAASASGERRRQGTITTAGHPHARRALVAGAWASRYPAKGRRHGPRRRAQLPKPSQDRRWQAPVRLCQRCRHLIARGKHANQGVVAIARARVGCLWAMATQVPFTSEGHKTPHHDTNNSGGFPLGIGRDAAPVWCHSRRRDETYRHPRASSEAGPRRTHVRGSSTPGEQQAHPPSLTGSVSSDGPRHHEAITMTPTSRHLFPSS